MNINKSHILGLLGLYIAQGIPFGVAMFALPGIFRSQGSPMTDIGMLALIMLPWGLKFTWASLVDNYKLPGDSGKGPHYLAWIKYCQWLSAILLTGLIFLHPVNHFVPLLILLVGVTLIHTTQDVAVDALAVELSKRNKQTNLNVNGVQVGGFSLGMLIGGSGALLAFDSWGWQAMVIYLLIMLWVVYTPFYLYQSDWEALPDTSEAKLNQKAGLLNSLKRASGWKILLVAFLFKFCGGIGEGLVTPLLVDQKVSLFWLSFITGSAMIITIGAGAFIATRIGHRFSLRPLACSSLALSALCWIVLGVYLSFGSSPIITSVLMVLEWLTMNIACVAFFGLFMRWCRPQQAGTDFTVLQCNEAIGGVIGMSLGAFLSSFIGFGNTFLTSGAVGVIASLALFWLLADKNLRVNESEETSHTLKTQVKA